MPRAGTIAVLLLYFICAAAAQTPAQNATPQTTTRPPASGYVGSNVCRGCHADIWLNFYKNPHYKSIASGTEPADRTGCEGCHGPGQAHVEAVGGKDTIPHAFSLMSPKAILDDCLRCHASNF